MKFSINALCPCGTKLKYKKCCRPLHKGAVAKDALQLMRSRYSAFALGEIAYIIKTSTFQKDFEDLLSFSQECEFTQLKIIEFINSDEVSYVTFEATLFCNGIDSSFREKSRFIKDKNRWLYEGAEIE
jgi:SEC-C motif-containing protein